MRTSVRGQKQGYESGWRTTKGKRNFSSFAYNWLPQRNVSRR